MKRIEEHNKKNSSYTMGVNQFADLTWNEFKRGYLAKERVNKSFNPEGEKLNDVE